MRTVIEELKQQLYKAEETCEDSEPVQDQQNVYPNSEKSFINKWIVQKT